MGWPGSTTCPPSRPLPVPGWRGSGPSVARWPPPRSGCSSSTCWPPDQEDEVIPSPCVIGKKTDLAAINRDRKEAEEWRLFYVASTRAQRRLVCSASHWYPGPTEPQGPSAFYEFVAEQRDIVTERFRHEAADVEPLHARQLRRLAEAEATAASAAAVAVVEDPAQLQLDDVAVPLATGASVDRAAPSALSVTALVSLARCPKQFWWSVVRPLPRRPSPAAR